MHAFILSLFLFIPTALASTPDYEETVEVIETEEEERRENSRNQIPIPSVIYGDDLSVSDIEEGEETGQITTVRSRREGEPTLQERMRADLVAWYQEKLVDLESFEQDLTAETDMSLRHVDGEGELDVLAQQEQADRDQHGPRARESDPAFAKGSSNALNPAPHTPSQQGDPCMSASGNSAQLAVAPVTNTYANACDGDSFAEHNDCTLGAVKEINSEAKGGSANSTQIMQAPDTRATDVLQGVDTAGTSDYTVPSCPTQPRLAESVMPNVADLVAADRQQFEQMDLVPGANTAAVARNQPASQFVVSVVPWYQKLLSFVFPTQVLANTSPSGGLPDTVRGRTNTTGRENELQKQNFTKFVSDLESHPDMAAEQQFANTVSSMMEEHNKLLRTKHQLTTTIRENIDEIANKKQVPY